MMAARIQRTAGLGKTPPGAGYPSRTICPVIFTICIPIARRSGTIASARALFRSRKQEGMFCGPNSECADARAGPSARSA
jgi:hypothetical protein